MLKIFRKVRYDLMGKSRPDGQASKTGMYLKYALGEVILVVIGILMALQINNWNEDRKNSIQEQFYLKGLKKDILSQIDNLNTGIVREKESIENVRFLIQAYNKHGGFKYSTKTVRSFTEILKINIMSNNNTVFEEINGSGQIGLIKNDSLRNSLVDFYQNISEIINNSLRNAENIFFTQTFQPISTAILIKPNDIMLQKLQLQSENMQIAINPGLEKRLMSTLELPENELKLLNAMNMRLIIAKFSQARNEQMNSKAQKLLELVESEIKD